MNKKLTLAAALAALTLALPAAAQQSAPPPARPQIGIGVGIFPLAVPSVNAGTVSRTVEVYVPIGVAPNFRLEPSLGIASNDQPAGPNEVDTRDFTLGLGGFYVARLAPALDWYAGGRLKLNFAHVSTPAGSDSGTDFSLAGAVGGEYYLVPKFSVGLEGELGLYQNSNVSGDDDGWFTTGIAFLRLYFK